MEAVTFLTYVQRNETALIAATEYVHAYGGVSFFELGDVFDWHREGEAGSVQGVFVGLVLVKLVRVTCNWMKGQTKHFESEVFLIFTTACFLACGSVTGAV